MKYLACCLALFLLLAPPRTVRAGDAATGPSAVVEVLHDTLLGVMKQAKTLGYDGRYQLLEPVVTAAFDLPFMAEKTVGRSWGRLDASQRDRLVKAFAELSVTNYASRFDGYSGERFEILGEESAPLDTILVLSRIVIPEDDDVELSYRLREVDGHWRIVDVYLQGTISELAMRRSEYASILRRKGFEALLQALDERVTALSSGAQAAGS